MNQTIGIQTIKIMSPKINFLSIYRATINKLIKERLGKIQGKNKRVKETEPHPCCPMSYRSLDNAELGLIGL